MGIQSPLEACAQLAHGCQPGMSPLDNPAVSSESLLALDAFARNAGLDTPLTQVVAAALAIVSLVGMQLSWPA